MYQKRLLECSISPVKIERGTKWISVNLKNISDKPLDRLEVSLHAIEPYFLSVVRPDSYISKMEDGGIESIPFQIGARESGKVYLTVTGYQEGKEFYWDSAPVKIRVKEEIAEIKNVLVLSKPKVKKHKLIDAEATVRTYSPDHSYVLKFWLNSPSSYEQIDGIETDTLEKDVEKTYSIDLSTEETGKHELHVYLYEDSELISREKDKLITVE